MSDVCPCCGVKLTMLNTSVGGALKTGEKLCLNCYRKAGSVNEDFGLHSKKYTLEEAKDFIKQAADNQTVTDKQVVKEDVTAEKNKKGNRNGWIGLIVIGLLVFIGFRMCSDTEDAQARKAYHVAKKFVEDKLRAPASAVFSEECKYTIQEDSVWIIKSYVDASNALGVKLRHDFGVAMKYKGGTMTDRNNWILIDVRFESR